MKDQIVIEALELSTCLGVPEAERAVPQRLTVTLRLETEHGCAGLGDEIGKTVDYFAVACALQAEARRTPRRLLETLGEDLARVALEGFAITAVEVELRKYILPDAAFVAVRLRREQAEAQGALRARSSTSRST